MDPVTTEHLRFQCRRNRTALLLRPGRGAEYCDQFVSQCVCLSVREYISGTAGPIFTKFCLHIHCGHGSVLLWRRCDKLCTSGFVLLHIIDDNQKVLYSLISVLLVT